MIKRLPVLLALLPLVAISPLSCDGGDEANLSGDIPCSPDNPCGSGATCLNNRCVTNGSLKGGDTCSAQAQCGENLVCVDFVCTRGCTDLYHLDECVDETWCKPVPGSTLELESGDVVPLGECAPSECDPSQTTTCDDGNACVAITTTIGACLPYCQYGFQNDTYFDTCTDTAEVDNACQPLGLTNVPVCIPAGDSGAPAVGIAGCDAVRNPCAAGSICFNVVCRQLCTATQLSPCSVGEVCSTVGDRSDISYCKAQ